MGWATRDYKFGSGKGNKLKRGLGADEWASFGCRVLLHYTGFYHFKIRLLQHVQHGAIQPDHSEGKAGAEFTVICTGFWWAFRKRARSWFEL